VHRCAGDGEQDVIHAVETPVNGREAHARAPRDLLAAQPVAAHLLQKFHARVDHGAVDGLVTGSCQVDHRLSCVSDALRDRRRQSANWLSRLLLLICACLQRQAAGGGGACARRRGDRCARTPSLISVRDPWLRIGDMMVDGVFRDAVRPLCL